MYCFEQLDEPQEQLGFDGFDVPWVGVEVTAEIRSLIDRGALFVVNHSAGADSQAMLIELKKVIPHHQLVIIHAELPGVDWGGLLEHIESTRGEIPFRSCVAVKTFFDMVDHRRDWPSPQQRQCTSDLKRGPIERTIRHLVKELGHSGLIVNCVGIRAQESSRRAKANPWQYSERNSKNGREWYEWLPIFEMTLTQRSQVIAAAGQKPHWAYLAGMTRLSCQICIMSSKHDLMTAARLSPELYAKYVAKEKELDRTIMMPPKKGPRLFLEDITGIRADPKYLPNAQGYQQAV